MNAFFRPALFLDNGIESGYNRVGVHSPVGATFLAPVGQAAPISPEASQVGTLVAFGPVGRCPSTGAMNVAPTTWWYPTIRFPDLIFQRHQTAFTRFYVSSRHNR